jgi:hypothetical protein
MNGADVSQDWTAAAAHYLVNASLYSARSLDLSYAVLRRVADGTLTPTAIRDTVTRASDERRKQYAADVGQITCELFGALVQVITGAVASPPAVPVDDMATWLARLGDYSRSAHGESVRRYERAVEALASGSRTAADVQAELSATYTHIALDRLRAAATLSFDALSRLAKLNAQFEQESVGVLLRRGSLNALPALMLTGPVGERSTLLVSIENIRSDPAELDCTLLEVRRADGGGPAFTADADIHINRPRLEPGDEAEVTVGIHLDSARFATGHRYVSALRLLRQGDRSLDMPLAITPTAPRGAAFAR